MSNSILVLVAIYFDFISLVKGVLFAYLLILD